MKSFESRERHDADAVSVHVCHVEVFVSGYAARACSNSQTAYSIFVWMKAKSLVLLLPWHFVDLVHCKSLVKEFNDTVVESYEKEICTKLQLDCCICIQLSGANNCSVIKPFVTSGNRKSIANIGGNFKVFGKFTGLFATPNFLTGKTVASIETDRTERGPVGATMAERKELKPDGVLMSGMSYKLRERTNSAPPASGMSGGSETPSLAGMDSANFAAVAAIDAASPGAVAQRARGFQPATAFENRRPASLRLALANPTEVGRSHDAGKSFWQRKIDEGRQHITVFLWKWTMS